MHTSQPTIMIDPGDTAMKVYTIPSRVIPSQLDTYLTIGNGHHELCLVGDHGTLLAMFRAAADMLDAHYLPCGCRVGALDGDTHPATCGDTTAVAAAGIAAARTALTSHPCCDEDVDGPHAKTCTNWDTPNDEPAGEMGNDGSREMAAAERVVTVYLAGPMRGLPEFNFPAFDQAAADLRNLGYHVLNPAENDRANGFDPTGMAGTDAELVAVDFDLNAAMEWDLDAIRRADGLVALPGWVHSEGARREIEAAMAAGKWWMEMWQIVEDGAPSDTSIAASHEFRLAHLYECAACTEKWERNRDTDLAAIEADDDAEAVA